MTPGRNWSGPDATDASDDVRQRLRDLRVDPPDAGFRAALHLRLVAAGTPPLPGFLARLRGVWERHRAVAWPGVGVLAGAASFAVLTWARDVPPAAISTVPAVTTSATSVPADRMGEVPPTYTLPARKVAVIRLTFAAEVAVEDATFEVSLPEGLAFWSRGQELAERTFRWPGRLAAGDNPIPIAVRGKRPGLYHVRARVEAAGGVLEQELVLDVKGEAG